MQQSGLTFGLPFLLETAGVQEASHLAKELGFCFVELNSNFPQNTLDQLQTLPLKELQEEYGVFFTIHLDDSFDPFDFNPKVRAAYTETMLDALELAGKAGIPIINMHLPRGNIVTLPHRRHYLYEDYQEMFIDAVHQFKSRCEQAGSPARITIENTNRWASYEQEAIKMLLQSPIFALCLDTGHDHAAGNKDLAFITEHKERLIHMHLHDGWNQTNHQALGTGEIPLFDRLSLAKEVCATVVLETKTKEALLQSVRYLKQEKWLP